MDLTRYLLFTGLVKHGELLRYLLAAQVRKRLLEKYNIRRQVKSSALTGNPDRILEVYYIDNVGADEPRRTLEALRGDPSFMASHTVTEEARITKNERFYKLHVPPPLQTLSQMPYLNERMSQETCARTFAETPYLLHVTCTLHFVAKLNDFNEAMRILIKEFKRAGLSLVMAGRHTGMFNIPRADENGNSHGPIHQHIHPDVGGPIKILNIWQFNNPDSPKTLMARLAESEVYSMIDKICDQDQHICRNISRHYQLYPLLGGPTLLVT